MKIEHQVYKLIQERLKRICFDTWTKAKKNRKGRLTGPLTYPVEVDHLIELANKVLDMDQDQVESIATEITNGSVQDLYLKSTCQ